jgi:hypothetical protein
MDPRYEVYKMYRKIMEKRYEDESNREFYEELGDMMDRDMPEFGKHYEAERQIREREAEIQKTFTREQQDFICWQIGEWYVNWKHQIVSGCNPGQHRLGYAKEQLKSMICGDGND